MAGEYLQRTPTSTGNRRVFTWSGWVKFEKDKADAYIWHCTTDTANHGFITYRNGNIAFAFNVSSTTYLNVSTVSKIRDFSSWTNLIVVLDTTQTSSRNRYGIYINGIYQPLTITTEPTINISSNFNTTAPHFLGVYGSSISSTYSTEANLADVFFVDGQALTPDVFGFYKQGKGYISAGSTQATDFRPGQWVPKTPRVIKTEINRRGGFGVNGFYLPMNDSNNFGADFHGEPNSIITLNEKLPQPRVGVVTTASVGLGYTDALRADPYAANLVLALPFVSGGLSSGFGDYAPSIKGSGSAKTMSSGSVSIASTASYYGTSANYQNSNSYVDTPGTSGDFNMGTGDFTVEGWFYPTANSGNVRLFGQNTNTYNAWDVYISGSSSSGQLWMMGGAYQLTSASIQGNQWNHVAISRKNLVWTTYINGVAAGIVTSILNNTVGDSTNKFRVGAIGENAYGGVGYSFQGYIQDFRVYKGVAKYTGGFDVPRPYTPVGIATWRAVPDCTANNFATWNAVQNSMSLTDGNLTCTGTGSNQEVYSTVGITTGKWYVEARTNVGTYNHFGVRANSTATYDSTYRLIARDDGAVYGDTSQGQVGTLSSGYASAGSIVAMAIDGNLGQITYYVNGVNVGGPYSIYQYNSSSLPTPYKIYNLVNSGDSLTVNFGQNPTFSGNTTAGTFTDSNGKGLFKYQPPSGFLALCEDNLPTPAISNPGQYFKTVLYTGDNRDGRSIVGVGFTPDLVWVKSRNAAYGHVLFDSVRGPYYLLPFTTGGDNSAGTLGWASGGGLSMLSDGFNVAYGTNESINGSGTNMVAWCWRAGAGTTSTNTNGSIPSVVSVNQDAGFSIVSWNMLSGTYTIGHGLGKTPKLIITKQRDANIGWWTYSSVLGSGNYLALNETSASRSASWGGDPTASTFTINNSYALSGQRMIAYCWAEIEGFSKFGSYVGNGNADGPFVYCGFKPAFVMIKRTDGGVENWIMFDNVRKSVNDGDQRASFANLSDAEGTGWPIDFVSNGFKNRYTGSTNANGATYIFVAFAESPFQTANAK